MSLRRRPMVTAQIVRMIEQTMKLSRYVIKRAGAEVQGTVRLVPGAEEAGLA